MSPNAFPGVELAPVVINMLQQQWAECRQLGIEVAYLKTAERLAAQATDPPESTWGWKEDPPFAVATDIVPDADEKGWLSLCRVDNRGVILVRSEVTIAEISKTRPYRLVVMETPDFNKGQVRALLGMLVEQESLHWEPTFPKSSETLERTFVD